MEDFLPFIVLVPLFIMLYQFYSYAIRSTGIEKQRRCQSTGLVFLTVGICSLVFKTTITVFGGLILMMFGFRLVSFGLDRIDKNTFIDHYGDDDTPKQ